MSQVDTTGIEYRLAYLSSHRGSCSKEQKLLIPLASFSHGSQDCSIKTLSSCTGSCPRHLSHCCELCGSEKRNCSTGKDRGVACISLLWGEHIAAVPQEQLCHLPAMEVHPPQPPQPGHVHQWVTRSHLKTWCVFHLIACDSDYFSTFQILPLAALCVLYLRLRAGFLVLICTQLFLIAREEGDGNQTACRRHRKNC